ncbi:MAG TPA: diaminopimelate epimerase [Pirellulales bacterium]|nr:diaminopimelate epimerase [Pirellulales bacterium]
MRFTKMHGIGNDYVYVNCFAQPMPADPAALAKKIADRHFGVGGDGLILICPSDKADARMRMFNADGSEAEMCGNGVRCVAKYVYDHGIAKKPTLKIETGRGVLTLNLEAAGGKVAKVRVDMGEPILEAAKIPVELGGASASDSVIDYDLDLALDQLFAGWKIVQREHPMRAAMFPRADQPKPIRYPGIKEEDMPLPKDPWTAICELDRRITCVSMGNPHVVLYCRNVSEVPLEKVGHFLEQAMIFPKKANIHFVELKSPFELTMRTWERGSGITLACGTGASAVCVAGVLTGRTGRKILAHLPGGDLELEWNETDNHVYMTGPATEVFSGEWPE